MSRKFLTVQEALQYTNYLSYEEIEPDSFSEEEEIDDCIIKQHSGTI